MLIASRCVVVVGPVLSLLCGYRAADSSTFIALNKILMAAIEQSPCCYRAHQALGDVCVLRRCVIPTMRVE